MTADVTVSLADLGDLLRDCRDARRVEAQPFYATDRADFGRTPPEVGWWSDLLGQIAARHAEGQQRTRVDVLPDEPNDYWQWRQRTNPWHVRAGEGMFYLSRRRALEIGLPLDHDWWLIDGRFVVQLWFTAEGVLDHMRLIGDPAAVGVYRRWWDLAIRDAAPAERTAAA
jgi:hypothetical protein